MTRIRAARGRRGVTLIVVLWTILLLTSVTAIASSASRGGADVTSAIRAQAIARAMAESGIVSAVSRIEGELRGAANDSAARLAYLDGLESTSARDGLVADSLESGSFAVAVVDVAARLDVNEAGYEGWKALLTHPAVSRTAVSSGSDAESVARAIDARVRGDRSRELRRDAPGRADDERRQRDSLLSTMLGRSVQRRRPFEELDALLEIPGVSPQLLEAIAPLLTVDGDGRINRRAAAPAVLAAAAGSLVDHPVRLLLVSRGWMRGHPLTREIEAVYDIADDGLHLVRWRERDR